MGSSLQRSPEGRRLAGPWQAHACFSAISANSGGKADFMTEIIRTFANG